MTQEEFRAAYEGMGISRAEFCRRIGIAPNSGTAYALGRQAIPQTVALAVLAIKHGLGPQNDTEAVIETT